MSQGCRYLLGVAQRLATLLICLLIGCSSGEAPSVSENSETDSQTVTPEPKALAQASRPSSTLTKASFEKRIGGPGNSFTLLDPGSTGVAFENYWDLEANPDLPYQSSFIGSGVAIGDYDNDGRPDLFLTRKQDGGRLYRNLGNWKFEDVTDSVGIGEGHQWSTGATFVDINHDGWLDLLVCSYRSPNRLYINTGNQFEERGREYGLDYQGASIGMAFADYDLDGDLDAYLITNRIPPSRNEEGVRRYQTDENGVPIIPEVDRESFMGIRLPNGEYRVVEAAQYDYLFRNDQGRFVDATQESRIGHNPHFGLSATWWDYNDDNRPDLYVANDFFGPDHLFTNQGGGHFQDAVQHASLPHTPWYSMGSDAGDLNNDGWLDYMASDMAGTNHYRDKLSMGAMSGPNSVAWFLNASKPPQYMRNSVYVNTGTNRFMEMAHMCDLSSTDWTWTVRICDLDNDGWQDIFCTNGMTRDWFNGDFNDIVREKRKQSGRAAGRAFWLSKPLFKLENLVFRNEGDFKFSNQSTDWGLDHLGVNTGAATGDLDGDGDLDLVVSGFNEPVRLYRNDVATGNSIKVRLVGTDSNRDGLGAKVTIHHGEQLQTRYVCRERGFMSSSDIVLLFGLGATQTIDALTVRWPSGTQQRFENLAANAFYTIVESDEHADTHPNNDRLTLFRESDRLAADVGHKEFEYDDFKDQPLIPNKYSQLGPGIAWGDIDGDQVDEFFMGGASIYPGQWVYRDGDTFQPRHDETLRGDRICEDLGAALIDVDRDGDRDLYVASGSNEAEAGDRRYQDRLYLNDGKGNFTKDEQALPEISASTGVVAPADFDRDGDLDLFVGGRIVPRQYPTAPQSYLLQNDQGKFQDVAQELAPDIAQAGMVTSAVWSDVNGDQWIDLLVTYEWGPVRLFLNRQGRLEDVTQAAGLAERQGWYNSISAGDIDNDGDIDYVIGNFGLNTKYYASDEKPELLYYGDFEGDGTKHIVEAKYENGVCLPRRGLGCTSHAMPEIKVKLPTYHDFASSPLEDIYSDNDGLDGAEKFQINSLYSCLLINQTGDDGVPSFQFVNLPRIAQVSPIFGSALVDCNLDGNLDLLVAQNFYGPQRETGYMDGGVSMLFLGDGSGSFQPVWPHLSGIVITGDATSLTVADVNDDQRPDFLVARNADSPVLYENQGQARGRVIQLRGIPGNLNAIGARIQVQFDNGSQRTHEIQGGGSYLAQSNNLIFLPGNSDILSIKILWPNGDQNSLDEEVNQEGQQIIEILQASPGD